MAKFCVLKSSIENNKGVIIINHEALLSIMVCEHPKTRKPVYLAETLRGSFYFTEFVTKESSLQEATEYYHHELYKDELIKQP